ncbi:restriction endonuclease subunit S [Mesobacillus zeae]|uniref:restriction endonuclease subunit S n=1 Tax=Mesobacillus zeae TaxID=1917180 RepID=UPI00300A3DFB
MKNNHTPEIRFPGYTRDWEERKFQDDIVSIQTGTNLLGSESNDGIPLIKMGNVQRGYFSLDKLEYIDGSEPVSESDIVNNGDFLFNTRNTLELVGKGATWFGESGNYAFNSNIARFTFMGINTYFFNYLYNTQKMIKQVRARAVGTTSVAAVYPRDLNSMEYKVPSIEEQSKIGDFFKQLDDTISLHQQELTTLKQTKQGFLQKMFPKEGETVPEIRFAGFSGEWEKSELRDFVGDVISDGDWIEKEHIHDSGEYRIIQTGNLGVGTYLDKADNAKYMNKKSFDELKANQIFPGDILISRLADPAGRTIILPNISFKMVTAVDVTIIRSNDKFDSNFFVAEMNSNEILNEVSKQVSGTSHRRISRKNLEKIKINTTSIEEQIKIGNFFKQLDDTIALHQRGLDALKDTKQAFLQKMFV